MGIKEQQQWNSKENQNVRTKEKDNNKLGGEENSKIYKTSSEQLEDNLIDE